MPKPAIVKFIGKEADYRISCEKGNGFFCRDCANVQDCKKEPQYLLTNGRCYEAFFLEYWEGERNSLHVCGNDGEIHDFIPFEDFEVISDRDNVLNDYEAIVRCITHDYDDELFDLTYGKTYKAIGCDADGMYLVMDESCCCYFYPAREFEIVDDPRDILSHQSCYYSYNGGKNDDTPDYIAAHLFCGNHKPELEKDHVCGCFYCLNIFSPTEIEEWLIEDNPADKRGTAICPYCGIDSVIGESSGYPITKEFLQKMHDYWMRPKEL